MLEQSLHQKEEQQAYLAAQVQKIKKSMNALVTQVGTAMLSDPAPSQ